MSLDRSPAQERRGGQRAARPRGGSWLAGKGAEKGLAAAAAPLCPTRRTVGRYFPALLAWPLPGSLRAGASPLNGARESDVVCMRMRVSTCNLLSWALHYDLREGRDDGRQGFVCCWANSSPHVMIVVVVTVFLLRFSRQQPLLSFPLPSNLRFPLRFHNAYLGWTRQKCGRQR